MTSLQASVNLLTCIVDCMEGVIVSLIKNIIANKKRRMLKNGASVKAGSKKYVQIYDKTH